jgi:hypothetical protein
MIQQLKINISNADCVKILAWLNHQPMSIEKVIDIDLSIDNVVEIRQESSEGNAFFNIDSVCLGNLNITELLHHCGICRIQDSTGNKIADFVPNIGAPDHVIININRDIYRIIVQYINVVSVL